MRLRRIIPFLIIGVVAVAMVTAPRVFYLGPTMHLAKREKLLASLTLPDRSVIFLVQTPNKTSTEPYTVYLHRLFPNQTAQSCLIGFEESYWWFPGLRNSGQQRVEITFCGSVECSYDLETGIRDWKDKSYRPLSSKQADYTTISNKVRRLGYAWD